MSGPSSCGPGIFMHQTGVRRNREGRGVFMRKTHGATGERTLEGGLPGNRCGASLLAKPRNHPRHERPAQRSRSVDDVIAITRACGDRRELHHFAAPDAIHDEDVGRERKPSPASAPAMATVNSSMMKVGRTCARSMPAASAQLRHSLEAADWISRLSASRFATSAARPREHVCGAHRHQRAAGQRFGLHAFPAARAVAHGNVELLARQIDEADRGQEFQRAVGKNAP